MIGKTPALLNCKSWSAQQLHPCAVCTWNNTYNTLCHLKSGLNHLQVILFIFYIHVKSISISYSLFIPKIYWESTLLFIISLVPTFVQTTVFSFLEFYCNLTPCLLCFTFNYSLFPSSSAVKNPPAMQEMQVEKIPWRRKWQPTPDFSLRNPMNRGAWWAVHGVAKESDRTWWLKQQTVVYSAAPAF